MRQADLSGQVPKHNSGETADARMNSIRVWRPPPAGWGLSKGQVHVWRASLDVSEDRLRDLERTLSRDEQSRAGRFKFAQERRRFIAARGILRTLLGRYLVVDPCLLQFSYGMWGKPFLSSMPRHRNLGFNLSHSGGLALYAVALGSVGIDLERICAVKEMEQIARRFFSPSERRSLRRLAGPSRQVAFFGCWTRREAYAKATGRGLTMPGEGAGLPMLGQSLGQKRKRWGFVPPSCWTLYELCPGPGYAAALAARGRGAQIECWQLVDSQESL